MVSRRVKDQGCSRRIKDFFCVDSLEDINKKLDKFYIVLILRSLHSNFDHVCDQVLASDQIHSMDNLVTRFLRVPTLVKNENSTNVFETSTMVAPRGRGGGQSNHGGRSGRSGSPQCLYCNRMGHTQEKCYSFHGFLDKVTCVSKSDNSKNRIFYKEYQEYFRYKFEKFTNPGLPSSMSNVSTTCISQSMEGHSPRIVDLGASNHVSSNISSFSSISFHKIPYFIVVAMNWQSFFISFTKFELCFVHSSHSLQFNLFETIDSFVKLLCNIYKSREI